MNCKIILLAIFISISGIATSSNNEFYLKEVNKTSLKLPASNEITGLLRFVIGYVGSYEIYTNASVEYEMVNGVIIPVRFDYLGAGLYSSPDDIITSYSIEGGKEPGSLYYSGSYIYKTPDGNTGTNHFYISISDITIVDDMIIW